MTSYIEPGVDDRVQMSIRTSPCSQRNEVRWGGGGGFGFCATLLYVAQFMSVAWPEGELDSMRGKVLDFGAKMNQSRLQLHTEPKPTTASIHALIQNKERCYRREQQ